MNNLHKSTAIAGTNIAFAKYWGKANQDDKRPVNGSVSMTLGQYGNAEGLHTKTTVEFSGAYSADEFWLGGEKIDDKKAQKVFEHLDRVRLEHSKKLSSALNLRAKVMSQNNFPIGTGLSSSASGFAALTQAASAAAGLDLNERELTVLSRQGSGSSCRSIPGGFVEWVVGEESDDSYAYQIHPADHWDIVDIVALVSKGQKQVSSTDGQKLAHTSPLFSIRKKTMPAKIEKFKQLIAEKNFSEFGELCESEALELHAQFTTQKPPLIYMTPECLRLITLVQQWRNEMELPVYFTLNTGQDVHLLCQSKDVDAVQAQLQQLDFVQKSIPNAAGEGAKVVTDHLF